MAYSGSHLYCQCVLDCRCWGENRALQSQYDGETDIGAFSRNSKSIQAPSQAAVDPQLSTQDDTYPRAPTHYGTFSGALTEGHNRLGDSLPLAVALPVATAHPSHHDHLVSSGSVSILSADSQCSGRHRLRGHPLGHSFAPSYDKGVAKPPPHGPIKQPLILAGLAGIPITSVAAGEGHMVALTASGQVYTWGDGKAGACGHGTTEHTWLPQSVQLMPGSHKGPALTQASLSRYNSEVTANFDDRLIAYVGLRLARDIVTRPELISLPVRESLQGTSLDVELAPRLERNKSAVGIGSLNFIGTPVRVTSTDLDDLSTLPDTSTISGTSCRPIPTDMPMAVDASKMPEPRCKSDTSSAEYDSSDASGIPKWAAARISAGSHHTVIITRLGRAVVFGWSQHGRLGNGRDDARAMPCPTTIERLPTLVAAACGYAHTLLLTADGRLYAAGSNSCGQLGVHPGFTVLAGGVLSLLNTKEQELAAHHLHPLCATPDDLDVCAAVGAAERLVPLPSHTTRPEQVTGPVFQNAVVMAIAAGGNSSSCTDAAGRLWMWGWSEDGNGGSGLDRDAWNPRLVARFANLRVLQVRLILLCMRNRNYFVPMPF